MNYVIGFFVWWIIVLIIYVGVYCFERQTKETAKILRKYVQMILYILCMLSGYLIAFLVTNICDFGFFSALGGAIVLLITWKIAYVIFGRIWRNRNQDTGVVEYNIELSEGERQWCNSISIGGMIVIGAVLFTQTGEKDYFEIISMACSIWIGSYISIQKVQQKNTIQEILQDWKNVFKVESNIVPISSTFFMCMLVAALIFLKKTQMIFDEIMKGFVCGIVLFLIGVIVKNKLHIRSR